MEHDLRTPFAGISGISQMLYEMETDPDKKELLEMLVKSCNQWEETHQQIIRVLSVQEPQEIKKECFSISNELLETKEMFEATAYLKQLNLIIDPIPTKCDQIETDKMKFRLILSSLIGNAVKYTEKGSVRIKTSCNDASYIIEVIDTGIGIPKDQLDYIFEQFTKLCGSNKRDEFEGVGSGLYVSRQMAAQLGGSITVESKLGEGSTFIFTLHPQNAKNQI